MSQWAEIRQMPVVDGVPKKQIAERLGLDIKTVRRAAAPARRAVSRPRHLDRWRAQIEQWLRQDRRLTATRIRRLLLPLAGPVAERTVRWYVARLKAAAAPKEVYVHRSPRPGVTLEVDVGESWAEVAGVLRKVKYVVATLPYSNVYFAKAYRECSSLSGLSGLSGALGDGRSATRRPACSRGEDWTPAEPGPHESRQPRDERPTRVHDPAPALAHAVGLADPRVAAVRRHAVASAPAPSTHPVRVGPSTRSTTDARPRPVARSVTPATTLVSAPPRPVRGGRRTLQTQRRASSTGVAREGIDAPASSVGVAAHVGVTRPHTSPRITRTHSECVTRRSV